MKLKKRFLSIPLWIYSIREIQSLNMSIDYQDQTVLYVSIQIPSK